VSASARKAPASETAHPGGDSRWGATGLTVRFGERLALDDVSLEAPRGAVTAVVGGDGAGKTTLLRTLAGVISPASGAVRAPSRRRIGYVSAGSGVYGDLSVTENLAFTGNAYGVTGEALARRIDELLADTGLTAARERLAGRLSGGMRQKLAVACATIHHPPLLILDEPSTGVDPVSRGELWRAIRGGADGGAAVVLSTTYMDEALRADHVLVLHEGRALASGTPAEVESAVPQPPPARRRDSAAATGPALVETRAVTRRFGSFTAVDGVDLHVAGGEVVGLLGANGAGKTTLIRLLLGLLRPDHGRVRLFGEPPSRETRLRLGYVPQSMGLWDDLTSRENLEFAAGAFGRPYVAPDDPDLAATGADLVRDLPLGIRRRLAFAAALGHHPDLLVLDEPTSGVDPLARARLWETIRGAADGGAAVLVTTHYMEEAANCDRLVVMADGRTIAAGTLAEIVGGDTLEDALVRLMKESRS
jgi:ABC-type multidrug transport system ATPase subunit